MYTYTCLPHGLPFTSSLLHGKDMYINREFQSRLLSTLMVNTRTGMGQANEAWSLPVRGCGLSFAPHRHPKCPYGTSPVMDTLLPWDTGFVRVSSGEQQGPATLGSQTLPTEWGLSPQSTQIASFLLENRTGPQTTCPNLIIAVAYKPDDPRF